MYPSNRWCINALALLGEDGNKQRFIDAATPGQRQQFDLHIENAKILAGLVFKHDNSPTKLTKDQKREKKHLDQLQRTEIRKLIWLYEHVTSSDESSSLLSRE